MVLDLAKLKGDMARHELGTIEESKRSEQQDSRIIDNKRYSHRPSSSGSLSKSGGL